jgi:hypothetical protein
MLLNLTGKALCVVIALAVLTGCMEHSPCTANHKNEVSPDGSGQIEIIYWVCKRGMFSKERYTTVEVGITKWGGLRGHVLRIENKHEVTARWIDSNHVVLICHDVSGDRVSEKLDSLTLTALQRDPSKSGIVGREGMMEVSETISITYDLQ